MNHGKQGSNTEYVNELVSNVGNQGSINLGMEVCGTIENTSQDRLSRDKKAVILHFQGGPNLITKVLMRGRKRVKVREEV